MAKNSSKALVDRSTVRQYKHFEELKACLASNWPASLTREYLIERYGPEGVPSEKAICRWREKHLDETARIVPAAIIKKKLKGIEYKVDVIGHLSRLVAICEDRVARGIEQEDSFGGMPLPLNDGVLQVYLQALRDYVKVAQDLGLVKGPPLPIFDFRTQNVYVTPETLEALRKTAERIREIKAQEASDVKQIRAEGRPASVEG